MYSTIIAARPQDTPQPVSCPRCLASGPHGVGPGAGPHYAQLTCVACGGFVRWLSRYGAKVAQRQTPCPPLETTIAQAFRQAAAQRMAGMAVCS